MTPVPLPLRFTFDDDTKSAALIRNYALSLCESLGLPVEIGHGEAPDKPRGKVVIGDEVIEPPANLAPDASLDCRLATAIFENRAFLVSDKIARALFDDWQMNPDEIDPRTFRDTLRTCVTSGWSVERLRSVLQPSLPAAPEAWLQRAFSAAGVSGAVIEVSETLHRDIESGAAGPFHNLTAERAGFDGLLEMMTEGLFWELGVLYRSELRPADLPEGTFRLRLNDIATPARPHIPRDEVLVALTPDKLSLSGGKGRPARNPANGMDAALVKASDPDWQKESLTVWSAVEYIVLSVSADLRRNAGAFATQDVLAFNLMRLRKFYPALVEGVERRYGLPVLTRALRLLLAEEISVRNLKHLLEAALDLRGTTKVSQDEYIVFGPHAGALVYDPDEAGEITAELLAEHMRKASKDYISHKYTRGQSTLVVYLVDQKIEAQLSGTSPDALPPDRKEAILAAIREGMANAVGTSLVLLTTTDVRRHLRALVAPEFPWLAVLAYDDLSPAMNIQPVARITLFDDQPLT